MFIRKLATQAAIAAVGLLALGAVSASAGPTALRTDPGGVLLTGSTTITNTSSDPATLVLAGVGTINCAQTRFDLDVSRNSSPSSITGTLTALTFTTCSDTIPVINISACHLDPDVAFPVVHITTTSDAGGTAQITDPTVRCGIAGSATSACYFTGTSSSAIGTLNNAASSLAFPNVTAHVVPGTGSLGAACGNTGTFSVTFTHIVQGGTNRTVTVTTS